jgi:glycosyltransferase involved in cell wall biosynthesis
MKICLISNLYPSISRGGAEKVALTVANGLKSAGHDVFVISTRPWNGRASLKSIVKEEGKTKIYRFYPFNIFYYLNDYKHNILIRLIWHFFDIFNHHSKVVVKKILQQEKPEVAMTHNLMGIGFLLPGMIRGLGIKHVHTLHDVQLAAPSGLITVRGPSSNALEDGPLYWPMRQLHGWYERICRRLFGSPDVVVSPSKWLMDFYTQKGFFKKSKKIVLSNPVETSQSPAERLATAATLSRGLRLLYLGQIEEHKGILFLVRMLLLLSEFLRHGVKIPSVKIPTNELTNDWQLHIAGDGSKMGEVEKIVGNDPRFIIHGRLEGEALEKIFSEVDLTVVPSLCYENSPTVIYESLSAGVPVAAAKIGGVAELIHDGENGFTFDAGNAEDLTRVLKHAAANRDELQKMRPAAAKSVENFGIENYIKKILTIIKF